MYSYRRCNGPRRTHEARHRTCRLLVWLGAAAVGWAVLLGVVLLLPQALAGFAVAGFLLWRKARRPVVVPVPVPGPARAPARRQADVRRLVAHSA